jgi:hypothetical protein
VNRRCISKYVLILWGIIVLVVISSPMFFGVKQGLGDLLFAESVARNLFHEGGSWKDWAVTPSPAYLPDLAVYLIGYLFLPAPPDTIFFVSMVQALCVVSLSCALIKALTGTLGLHTIFSVFLLLSLVSFCSYTSSMWFFFDSTNNHMGSLLCSIVALLVTMRALNQGVTVSTMILLVTVQTIGILNGQLFLIWWVLPCVVTLGIWLCSYFVVMPSGRNVRTPLLVFCATCVAFVLSGWIKPWITYWDSLDLAGRGRFNISNVPASVERFLTTISNLLVPYRSEFYLLYVLWVLGIVLLVFHVQRTFALQYFHAHTKSLFNSPVDRRGWSISFSPEALLPGPAQKFFFLYTMVLVPISFVAIMASGEFRYSIGLRYFLTPIYLPIVLSVASLLESGFVRRWSTWVLLGLIVSSCGVLCMFLDSYEKLKPHRISIEAAREYQQRPERRLADCLDANKDAYGLKSGVGDFWQARPISLLSRRGIRVVPVRDGSLTPYHYMSNVKWFLGEAGTPYAAPEYNFVVTSGLAISRIVSKYGPPTRQFTCPSVVGLILVYDKQQTRFDEQVKTFFKRMLIGDAILGGNQRIVRYTPDVFFLVAGRLAEDVAVSNKGSKGWFIIGPYARMKAGRYRVTLTYRTQGVPEGELVGRLEAFLSTGKILKAVNLESREKWARTEVVFELDQGVAYAPLELRVFTEGKAEISASEITLEVL